MLTINRGRLRGNIHDEKQTKAARGGFSLGVLRAWVNAVRWRL